jgi:hypothetical protein
VVCGGALRFSPGGTHVAPIEDWKDELHRLIPEWEGGEIPRRLATSTGNATAEGEGEGEGEGDADWLFVLPTAGGASIEPEALDFQNGALNFTLVNAPDVSTAFTNVGQRKTTLIPTRLLAAIINSVDEPLNAVLFGMVGTPSTNGTAGIALPVMLLKMEEEADGSDDYSVTGQILEELDDDPKEGVYGKALVDLATAFDLDSGEEALTKIREEGILFDNAVLFIDDVLDVFTLGAKPYVSGSYYECWNKIELGLLRPIPTLYCYFSNLT